VTAKEITFDVYKKIHINTAYKLTN